MPAPHRILLVPEARRSGAPAKIRRYSLARVRVAESRERLAPKFTHLRRVYD